MGRLGDIALEEKASEANVQGFIIKSWKITKIPYKQHITKIIIFLEI